LEREERAEMRVEELREALQRVSQDHSTVKDELQRLQTAYTVTEALYDALIARTPLERVVDVRKIEHRFALRLQNKYRAWRKVMGPIKWANPYKAVQRSIGEYSRLNQPSSLHNFGHQQLESAPAVDPSLLSPLPTTRRRYSGSRMPSGKYFGAESDHSLSPVSRRGSKVSMPATATLSVPDTGLGARSSKFVGLAGELKDRSSSRTVFSDAKDAGVPGWSKGRSSSDPDLVMEEPAKKPAVSKTLKSVMDLDVTFLEARLRRPEARQPSVDTPWVLSDSAWAALASQAAQKARGPAPLVPRVHGGHKLPPLTALDVPTAGE
jgi:hypothetical protein